VLIAAANENVLLAVKFEVKGNLRFISHAEMMRVFQRACVRAGVEVKYSRGFNPHPKMSLPLPRPVGVESDDELLCIHLDFKPDGFDDSFLQKISDELSQQLPDGCRIISIDIYPKKTSFQPCRATYILTVREEYPGDELKDRIEHILAEKNLNMQRSNSSAGAQNRVRETKIKNIDVRNFLKSIKLDSGSIIVECNISPGGSIRIEEVMELLELDNNELKAPIMRTNVQWQTN
jgi:radical SAM-linked protein